MTLINLSDSPSLTWQDGQRILWHARDHIIDPSKPIPEDFNDMPPQDKEWVFACRYAHGLLNSLLEIAI